jgi:2,3-bisphosphoglycerate-dependent phosphoglycerate mutase
MAGTGAAATLLLVRHGESETNAANVFTGWSDPPLTAAGEAEAEAIGTLLRARRLTPERAFASALQRSAATAGIILGRMGVEGIPVRRSEALNERDYGALTGLNKAAAAARWGDEQVRQWRRGYAAAPPEGESLRDTAARVLAYYVKDLLPAAMAGGVTLVVSHGNTLRALIMALEGLAPAEVEALELGTGATHLFALARDTSVLTHDILR